MNNISLTIYYKKFSSKNEKYDKNMIHVSYQKIKSDLIQKQNLTANTKIKFTYLPALVMAPSWVGSA